MNPAAPVTTIMNGDLRARAVRSGMIRLGADGRASSRHVAARVGFAATCHGRRGGMRGLENRGAAAAATTASRHAPTAETVVPARPAARLQPRVAAARARAIHAAQRHMSRRVVFIASLGHSGSTLLDLILGGHSSAVGLGEIGAAIRPKPADASRRTPVCSCGHPADDCRFWGAVQPRLDAEPDAGDGRRYEIVLDAFAETFGPDAVLVDSSKYLRWLTVLTDLADVDLRVLFLVRDVRSFTVSKIDNVARKRARGRAYAGVGPFSAFRRWHAANTRTERFVRDRGLPCLRLGYEELCLAPQRLVPRICDFIGIDFEPSMLSLAGSTSHVIRGNRMRHDSGRRTVSYDPRWFVRREWMLPALLCRRIMRSNLERVYSNGIVEDWRR